MAESLTINFGRPIPLLPLAGCLLFPHATVPLHIFEPRYRALICDALDSRGLIGMAIFQGKRWKQDYYGSPPICDHVCVGYILRHERLPDGRYQILLQGVCRAKVIRELDHDPYRKAILRPTEATPPMEIDLEERRSRIAQLLGNPMMQRLASVGAIRKLFSREMPTAVMVDLAILAVSSAVDDRYAMLAEPDAQVRADWLESRLKQTLRTLGVASCFRSGAVKDGFSLN